MAREILVHRGLLADILAADVAADLKGAALPCTYCELTAGDCVGGAADDYFRAEYLRRAGEELEAGNFGRGDFEAVFRLRGEGLCGEYCRRGGLVGGGIVGVIGAAETGEGEGHAGLWFRCGIGFEMLVRKVNMRRWSGI